MTKDNGCQINIMGSGTGVPSKKRSPSGFLLRIGRKNLLFDLGAGTMQRLSKIGVSYNDIDYIFLSHLHPDHSLDLVSFLFASRNPLAPRRKKIELIGPVGLEAFYGKIIKLYGGTILPKSYKVVIKELDDAFLKYRTWSVTAKRMIHTENSIGFRVKTPSGKIITYSGDTDYSSDVVKLGKNADLLILECSFPDPIKTKGHLTPSFAGRIAKECGAKKLLLTHLYPICDKFPITKQCRRFFKGEIVVAEDFLKLEL